MSRKTDSGIFIPKNHPEKYIGNKTIQYRSGWERSLLLYLDKPGNNTILRWAYEPFSISYKNPITKQYTFYWPDFYVETMAIDGSVSKELIEVKPMKEVPGYQPPVSKRTGKRGRLPQRTMTMQIINAAKWEAARRFCSARGMIFRIFTEETLFGANSHK